MPSQLERRIVEAALLPSLGTPPDQLSPRSPSLDGRSGARPLPDACCWPTSIRPPVCPSAARSRSRYEAVARRAGARRHQEAGPHPRRRRLARRRPRHPATTEPPDTAPTRPHALAHPRHAATATSTPPSTTTPAWPTARSSTDERSDTAAAFWRRAPAFFADARHHRRTRHDRQRRLLPVHAPSPRRSPPRSSTSAPGPTDHRPTARSNASTAPCSTNGPTSRSTSQTKTAPRPTPTGSTSTITTDPTPASEASPPPTAFTTSRGTTPSGVPRAGEARPPSRWRCPAPCRAARARPGGRPAAG